MNYTNQIKEILKNNNGIITSAVCRENNIPHVYLTRMVKDKEIIHLERGIYRDKNSSYDEYYFFQLHHNKCIYSFHSALYFHGLTDRVPFKKEVSLYKGYNPHAISEDVIIHFTNKDKYELGICYVDTQFGNKIKVYDKERTICDLIKNRRNIDVEIFKKAILMYMELDNKNFILLYQYARLLGVLKAVNDIVEVFNVKP